MEKMKQAGRTVAGYGAIVGAALSVLMLGGLALAGPSSAAADPVSTAFDDLESKVTLYGTAVVGLVVAVVVVFFGIKFLKKGANKA